MGNMRKKCNRKKDDNMEFIKDKTLSNDKKYKKINDKRALESINKCVKKYDTALKNLAKK
jgi:hypothetical protein